MNYKKIVLASFMGMLSLGAVFGEASSPDSYTIENFPGGTNIPTADHVESGLTNVLDAAKSYTDTVASDTITKVRNAVSSQYAIKGPCLFADLPTKGQKSGDIWIVTDRANSNFVWVVEGDTSKWVDFSAAIDISAYATKSASESYADNAVKLTANIKPTVTVGNVKAGTELNCNGWTVQQLLEEILAKDIQPTATAPSITALSLSFSPDNSVEVGTSVTPSYSITANLGSYSYGVVGSTSGTATGCTWSQFSLTPSSGSAITKTSTSGNLDAITATDDTNFYLTSVTGSYTAGGTPQTYNKKTATTTPIAASTASKTQNTTALTGYRQYFIYTGQKTSTLDSGTFRGVASTQRGNARSNSAITKTITLGANITRIAVAVPTDTSHTFKYTKQLTKCKNLGTGYEEGGFFVKQSGTTSIAGANSYSSMAYTVYIWDRGDVEGPFETGSKFELTIE